MQPRVMLQSQLHSQRGTAITGFLVADDEMKTDVGIVTADEFETLHVLCDDAGILAMGHQRQIQVGTRLVDLMQRIHLIHKHIARGGSHEEFDAGNACGVELSEESYIVIGGTEEETVVDMACLLCPCELVVERVQCCRLRLAVGHIKEGGHATESSCTRLALYVSFLRQPRLTEVNMFVDDAWQNIAPRGVYTFVVVSTGCLLALYDFLDAVIVNDEGAPEGASLVDDGSALYLCSHYYIVSVIFLLVLPRLLSLHRSLFRPLFLLLVCGGLSHLVGCRTIRRSGLRHRL